MERKELVLINVGFITQEFRTDFVPIKITLIPYAQT